MGGARIAAVVFDLGSTLLDETAMWSAAADEIGVAHATFLAALDTLIEHGGDHRRVFEAFGAPRHLPDLVYRDDMLYPDARPCLDRLRQQGFRVGIAANQPAHAEAFMRTLGELCVAGCSARWGCAKPSGAFFARLRAEVGLPGDAIAYVGDRVDNDVEPALAAGFTAVHLRRGRWARLGPPAPAGAIPIDTLDELPGALRDAPPVCGGA